MSNSKMTNPKSPIKRMPKIMSEAKINKRLAIEVMGWEVKTRGGQKFYPASKYRYLEESWNPCKNIAQAGEVVERMRKVYSFQISNSVAMWWDVVFSKDEKHWFSYKESAPMAICIAALAALGAVKLK